MSTYRTYQYSISAVLTVWNACSAQIGPIGRCRTYTVYSTFPMLPSAMFVRLYDRTSLVRRALTSMGSVLTANRTVATDPAAMDTSTMLAPRLSTVPRR
jgi:hypothetical protein